jgi:hypothetical protein
MTCDVFAVFESGHRTLKAEKILKEIRVPVETVHFPRKPGISCATALYFPSQFTEEALAALAPSVAPPDALFRKTAEKTFTRLCCLVSCLDSKRVTKMGYSSSRMSVTHLHGSKAAPFIGAEDSSPPINGGASEHCLRHPLARVMRIYPSVKCYKRLEPSRSTPLVW